MQPRDLSEHEAYVPGRGAEEVARDLGVEPEDLIHYGLIPEFVGRMPVITTLDELDEAALIEILKEPKNALVKQYQKLFELDHVTLHFTQNALKAIARQSMERKTGARGLRSIMEAKMMDIMYRLPSMEGVQECVVNSSTVEEGAEPLLFYEKRAKSA